MKKLIIIAVVLSMIAVSAKAASELLWSVRSNDGSLVIAATDNQVRVFVPLTNANGERYITAQEARAYLANVLPKKSTAAVICLVPTGTSTLAYQIGTSGLTSSSNYLCF